MISRDEHLARLERVKATFGTLPDDATLVLLRIEALLLPPPEPLRPPADPSPTVEPKRTTPRRR